MYRIQDVSGTCSEMHGCISMYYILVLDMIIHNNATKIIVPIPTITRIPLSLGFLTGIGRTNANAVKSITAK